jgi:hypothetical protein
VTGTLPTANGGTNLTSFTSGGVVYASSTSALATGSVLSFDGTNLGIGTSSPSTKFHVASSGSEVSRFETTGADMYLRFSNNFDANGYIGYQNSALTFWTANNLRATLNSTGLGIGTSSPSTKLEVVGAIKAAANSSNQLWAAAASGENSAHLRLSPSGASADQRDWSLVTYVAANGDCSLMVGASAGANPNAGTSVLTATKTGNIGIGTTSPNYKLQLNNAASGDSAYLQITHADAGTTNSDGMLIGLGVGASPNANFILYENAPMLFFTNGTERARFNPTGALVFAGGTTTANGIGITFPATQSASSDANTLDDYEEGSYTPTIQNATSYSFQSGQYTKIGRQVSVNGNIKCSFNNTGATTGITLGGLPFTSSSVASNFAIGSGFQIEGWNQANQNLRLQLGVSATTIYLYTTASSTGINYTEVFATTFGTTVEIEYSMTYFTA